MSDHIYVGTARWRRVSPAGLGGIYRSPVAGSGWERFPVGVGEAQVTALLDDPHRHDTLYAGTDSGLFRGTDQGTRWERLDLPEVHIWSVAAHPIDPDVLFAGSSPTGVYRSDDAGESWRVLAGSSRPERLDFPFESRVMQIAIDPANPDHMFASIELNGVIRSLDGGEHWEDCTDGLLSFLDQATRYRNKVAVDDDREGILDGHSICIPGNGPHSVIYANRLGLFGSDDQGTSWTDLDVRRFSHLTYARDIQVSPHDAGEMAVCLNVYSNGTSGAVYKSHDGGQSWARFDRDVEIQSTLLKLAYDRRAAGRLAAVSFYGQVLVTTDDGASFSERRLPDGAMEGYSIAFG